MRFTVVDINTTLLVRAFRHCFKVHVKLSVHFFFPNQQIITMVAHIIAVIVTAVVFMLGPLSYLKRKLAFRRFLWLVFSFALTQYKIAFQDKHISFVYFGAVLFFVVIYL